MCSGLTSWDRFVSSQKQKLDAFSLSLLTIPVFFILTVWEKNQKADWFDSKHEPKRILLK